jgi:hypothetical protein
VLSPLGIDFPKFTSLINTRNPKFDHPPWISIIYLQDYPIGRFFSGVRKNQSEALFSNFWNRTEDIPRFFGSQYLSQIYVANKAALFSLASRAPFLNSCCDAINDCEESFNWLLLADDIPEDLINEMRVDILFQRG